MIGVYWYCGCQGSGKTTAALEDIAKAIQEDGNPAMVIDWESAAQLAGVPHVGSVADMETKVWTERTHAAIDPDVDDDPEEAFERILTSTKRRAGAHILVDEASNVANPWYISKALIRAIRAVRHRNISIHLTTQQLRDIPRRALGLYTELNIFQHIEEEDLDRCENELRLDRDQVASLQVGQRLTIRRGLIK